MTDRMGGSEVKALPPVGATSQLPGGQQGPWSLAAAEAAQVGPLHKQGNKIGEVITLPRVTTSVQASPKPESRSGRPQELLPFAQKPFLTCEMLFHKPVTNLGAVTSQLAGSSVVSFPGLLPPWLPGFMGEEHLGGGLAGAQGYSSWPLPRPIVGAVGCGV